MYYTHDKLFTKLLRLNAISAELNIYRASQALTKELINLQLGYKINNRIVDISRNINDKSCRVYL